MNRWELQQVVEAMEELIDAKIRESRIKGQADFAIELDNATGDVVNKRITLMDHLESLLGDRRG